jgi:hypothetical protein
MRPTSIDPSPTTRELFDIAQILVGTRKDTKSRTHCEPSLSLRLRHSNGRSGLKLLLNGFVVNGKLGPACGAV